MQIPKRDELGSGNPGDVPLKLFADIDQGDPLTALQFCLKFFDCNLRYRWFGLLGGSGLRDAAEGIVVDEFRDARILAADRALRVAARLKLAEAHL